MYQLLQIDDWHTSWKVKHMHINTAAPVKNHKIHYSLSLMLWTS